MITSRAGLPCARLYTAALGLGLAAHGCTFETHIGRWTAGEDGSVPDVPSQGEDASVGDANPDAAGPRVDGGDCPPHGTDAGGCVRDGTFTSELLTVALGAGTSYFSQGRSVPAGEYTLAYVDGCWKAGNGFGPWSQNFGAAGYAVVGGQPEQFIANAPGSEEIFSGLNVYGFYDECVAQNLGSANVTFYFEGGLLGLRMDAFDLLALFSPEGGESVGGRNPTFRLTCIGSCR